MGQLMRVPTIVLNLHMLGDVDEANRQRAKVLRDLSGPADSIKRDGESEQLGGNDSGVNLENATKSPADNDLQGL
jgi:hypothetical protein